jgi:hypothetical protein
MLREKLLNEVSLGRLLGPYLSVPIPSLHISPVALVEKKAPGKFRLIHNLSAPVGHSVNDAISDDLKTVHYCRVSDVVDHVLRHDVIGGFLTKFDVKDAFRVVPVHRDDWKFLGMFCEGAYFINIMLPMGCGTSCAIFQSLTRAVQWMMERRFPEVRVFGYLDDFLLCSRDARSAREHKSGFVHMCETLGLPLAHDKTKGPDARLVFLGIGIDLESRSLFLDEERVRGAVEKIDHFVSKRSHRRVGWQSMVGTLSFLSQVVVPGRAFMSRVSEKLSGSSFWIHLDPMVREDLVCWKDFLLNNLFRSFDMMDSELLPAFHIFTDASGSCGFGAVMGSSWFYGRWQDGWWSRQNVMLLELYPIWASLHVWKLRLEASCVMVHTDNEALVAVLNSRRSKLPLANLLLRDISLLCMYKGIKLRVVHIPGVENCLADALSRSQMGRFRTLTKGGMDELPVVVEERYSTVACKHMLICC